MKIKKEKSPHPDRAWIGPRSGPRIAVPARRRRSHRHRCTSPLHWIWLPVLPAPRHAVARTAAGSVPLGEGEEGAAAASIVGEGRSATAEGSVRRCLVRPTVVRPPLLCWIYRVRARICLCRSPPGRRAPASNAPRRAHCSTCHAGLLHLPRLWERGRGALSMQDP
jgi:hypothetical protein